MHAAVWDTYTHVHSPDADELPCTHTQTQNIDYCVSLNQTGASCIQLMLANISERTDKIETRELMLTQAASSV